MDEKDIADNGDADASQEGARRCRRRGISQPADADAATIAELQCWMRRRDDGIGSQQAVVIRAWLGCTASLTVEGQGGE